ncbi:MAG: hypothetical protein KA175_14115 [Flavobacteriales bacterium]|nr:hypothetical protein [Flavobacteriales bacterium]MBP6698750.1 hypothetical protein [Flavobacteriales bacterium]
MKLQFVLLVICSGSTIGSIAQLPFEYTDQRTHITYYADVASQTDGWTVCGHSQFESGTYRFSFLTHFTSEGDTAWSLLMPNTAVPNARPSYLANAAGDRIVVGGMVLGCDPGPFDRLFLISIAPDASVDWAHEYTLFSAQDMAISASGSIAVLGHNKTLIANAAGDSLTSWPSGSRQVLWESDSTLLLANLNTIERRHHNGTQLHEDSLPAPTMKIALMDDRILALAANGDLFTLDSLFLPVDTTHLLSNFSFGDLIVSGDSLIAVSIDKIFLLDSSLSVLSSSIWDTQLAFPLGLFDDMAFAAPDRVAMVGMHPYNERLTGVLRTVHLNGDQALHTTNVGVEVASIDSSWYTGAPPTIYPEALVSIRISNLGTDTVNSVVLNAFYGEWLCSDVGRTYFYDALGLLPGADTVLTGIQPILYSGSVEDVQTQTFCIAALSPNHIFDRDQGDNLACDSVHITVGIEDQFRESKDVFIPNPFGDRIELNFPIMTTTPVHAHLFDTSGRTVAEFTVPAGAERFAWNASGLKGGLFVLRLDGMGTPIVRPMVHRAL